MKVVKQSFHYLLAQIFVMLSGLISFPLLTRILNVAEYGALSILNLTLLLSISISKMGMSKAAVRFFPGHKLNDEHSSYFSTVIIGTFVTAIIFGLILFSGLSVTHFPEFEKYLILSLMLALLLVIRSSTASLIAVYQAEQKTAFLNSVGVIRKYVSLAVALCVIFLFPKNRLTSFFMALAGTEFLLLIFLFNKSVFKPYLRLSAFSGRIFIKYAKYGIPLLASEITYILLAQGDRYFLQYFTNTETVGIYSAAYNLATYLQKLITVPITAAVVPIYLELYRKEGIQETSKFINKIYNYYLAVVIPLVAAFWLISGDVIHLLASEKYMEAQKILPFLIPSLLMYGIYYLQITGLLIARKTGGIALMMVIAALVNLILNYFLIPVWNINGAAIATLFAYTLLAVLARLISGRILPVKVNYRFLFSTLTGTVLMFLSMWWVYSQRLWFNLTVVIVLGGFIYGGFQFMVNRTMRDEIVTRFRQIVGSDRK